MELGAKYRFLQETKTRPMVGVFPHIEIPFGNERQGLGAGHVQILVPLWLQKSYQHWTSYGGGGYLFNAGAPDGDTWLLGWEVQNDLTEHLMLGGEIFEFIPVAGFSQAETNFNLGGQVNFDDEHHLLFSAGKSIHGNTAFMAYLGFQWTFGPAETKMEPEMPAPRPRRF
jgi:hypothetical protein